jgi:hypothetical protein
MALKSFKEVQAFFSAITAAGAPHHDFWNALSYTDFVTGVVPGVTVPGTDPPQTVPILTKGDGANSNIVQALAGTGLFDPNTGDFPQMPYQGPYFSATQIQELSDWIDSGCPE